MEFFKPTWFKIIFSIQVFILLFISSFFSWDYCVPIVDPNYPLSYTRTCGYLSEILKSAGDNNLLVVLAFFSAFVLFYPIACFIDTILGKDRKEIKILLIVIIGCIAFYFLWIFLAFIFVGVCGSGGDC